MPRALVHSDVSYLYVIGHDTGPQKIGFSQHPPSRARTLKVAGQPHYKAHWWVEAAQEDIRGLERLAHWLLRDCALGDELFDLTPQQAIDAIEDAGERYRRGERAPCKSDLMDRRVHLYLSRSFLDRIENWRRKQTPIPSQSEAIRFLAEKGTEIVMPD